MLNLLSFLTKLSENLQSVNNKINKYLKKPNAKQIHDIRTSIRRLDATFSTLPKKYRNGSSLSKYVIQCKELFKINSEIRDFDIIIEKLQKYPLSGQRDNIIEDLKKTKSEIDEKAPAETLYRSIHYHIDNSTGNYIKKVKYRVKIYDKDKAEDWMNLEISLYDNNQGSRETLNSIKAYVYNLEDGKIAETKVDKSSKFKSKESKYYTINKFAFPNIKNGSVIEFQYEITSPFSYEIPLTYIETDTPSEYTEYVFESPINMSYNIDFRGSLVPKYKKVAEENSYGAQYKTYRFGH